MVRLFSIIIILFLTACSTAPSEGAIQTAIAKTQAVLPAATMPPSTTDTPVATNTPLPTNTPAPTKTPAPTDTPVPTATPENYLGSRTNPIPLDTPTNLTKDDTMEFTLTIKEVLRGNEAWGKIKAANMFNDPPSEGMEYVLIKAAVEYTKGPSPDTILELNFTMFGVVSNNEILNNILFVVEPEPKFDLKMFPGAKKEGYVVEEVYKGDEGALLYTGDPGGFIRYFSLK